MARFTSPQDALRHHVSEAIEHGEATAITEQPTTEAMLARLARAAGDVVQYVNEGSECPMCGTDADHEPDCRILLLQEAIPAQAVRP